ncbi:ABC transporter permease [Massilia niabensis]|uniref:ABC transporter permease n=1 Tax=Massilia niabensis TaxID=544910 RepID=A0ABW0L3X1_9BURK
MEIRPIFAALLRNKTGPILVALQVALSLAILANAMHIVNERRGLTARPSGMADEHAVFHIEVRTLGNETPEQQLADIRRQTEVLRAVGGVAAVAQVSQMPMSRSGSNTSLALDPRQTKESTVGSVYLSGDSLIKTFGLNLVEGRDFLAPELIDVNEATESIYPPGVIITKPLAEKLWPGASAIGKTMYFGTGADARPTRIIGVVENLISAHAEFQERAMHSVIIPQRLYGGGRGTLYAVRTEPGQRDRVMKEAEGALRKSSPLPLILELTSTDKDRSSRYSGSVTVQWMLVTVSVLLLLVTCCGIVGMASLWITQRRKQIGVRRALGARRIDILRYFITENLMITSTGVVGGLLLGVALNQLLVSKLEMARLPLGYLGAGALVFWLLGVIAVYGPAWRAASTSPALATRSA